MDRVYDKISDREAFGLAVQHSMRLYPEVVALAADTGKSMGFAAAGEEFPDRVFNVGIAEQNMVNMAAGLASVGKQVFIGTYSTFLTLRALEQIRTFVCYPGLPVKMAGALAGLSGGIEGTTHQSVEDIAVMRALPGMNVIVPADASAAYAATRAVALENVPVYIRLGRYAMPSVYGEDYVFNFGKARVLRDGTDVTIICCGTMVWRSLAAAEMLEDQRISVRVLDMATIKPLDEEAVLCAAMETGAIVTAEEHSVIGGLGGAVAELLAEKRPTPVVRVGLRDCFAESAAQETLMDHYGLRVEDVVAAAKNVIERKGK
ncbi:MAG: transketolase family protein [Ruminococcaceae bacterium]|nr:transketolase family protein [Oscillospiraceae bacterium]